ncbi:MAG: NAD(P)/FAD-dependent oxidoreductase [Actinomycetota bacterium]
MNRRFLPSGRVQYLPRATYRNGQATVAPANLTLPVHARRCVVDATYMRVKVPSTNPPAYAVDPDAIVIAPNELPTIDSPPAGYTVVGAGKTAFDTIIWLLSNHVEPADIRWIAPRDSWLLNRSMTQPGNGFRIGEQIGFIAEAASAAEVFERLEAEGHFLRIDPAIDPTMYRCATVTEPELAQLRRIDRIVRGSRVVRITASQIVLTDGDLPSPPGTVHVDCTADGLERLPVCPVFEEHRITLQTLRACQQVFSAGLIGRIETLEHTDLDAKNELASVIPHPDTPTDFLTGTLAHIHNVGRWMARPEIADWLTSSRLSPTAGRAPEPGTAIQAVGNLNRFIADADE